MATVTCRHCGSVEVSIRISGDAYKTLLCKKCEKAFTLKNN